MKQSGKLALVLFGLGFLAVTLGLNNTSLVDAQQAGPPGGLSVRVVNTPLPVIGNLGISAPILAQQSGVWNVGIRTNATTPILVRDVDNAAHQPFQASAEVDVSNGFEGENGNLATVPAGKLLIMEHIGAQGFGPSGQKMAFRVNSRLSTSEVTPTEHYLVTNPRGAFGSQDYFEVSQSLRLYAGPGTTVVARIDRDQPTGTALGRFTLSGYLVNCGTGPGECSLP